MAVSYNTPQMPNTSGPMWQIPKLPDDFYTDPGLQHTQQTIEAFLARPVPGMPQPSGGSSGGSSGGGAGSSAWASQLLKTNPIAGYGNIGSGGSGQLADYAANRNYMQPADYFRTYAEGIDPTRYSDELRQYAQTVDPNAAVTPLMQFLQNFDPTGGMSNYFDQRIAQLQADPFTDTVLASRREGAFADMERDRAVALRQAQERAAAMGHAEGSGVALAMQDQINRQFNQQRAARQNQLVNEEFAMRRENLAQADALQLQRGQLNMQGQQLVGQLTGQVGQLMQQGLGMQNSLRIALGEMGLNEQSQQTQIIGQVSQLMAQGMQMEDALQTALAQTRTQEMGIRGQLQGALAGAAANVYGSQLGYAGQLAQARASSGAARAANELGWAQFQHGVEMDRLKLATSLPNLGTSPEDLYDRAAGAYR